jgi:hypothetical protein
LTKRAARKTEWLWRRCTASTSLIVTTNRNIF